MAVRTCIQFLCMILNLICQKCNAETYWLYVHVRLVCKSLYTRAICNYVTLCDLSTTGSTIFSQWCGLATEYHLLRVQQLQLVELKFYCTVCSCLLFTVTSKTIVWRCWGRHVRFVHSQYLLSRTVVFDGAPSSHSLKCSSSNFDNDQLRQAANKFIWTSDAKVKLLFFANWFCPCEINLLLKLIFKLESLKFVAEILTINIPNFAAYKGYHCAAQVLTVAYRSILHDESIGSYSFSFKLHANLVLGTKKL